MGTLNYSKQRKAIIDFLITRKDHPTADVIYKNVRNVFPNISLGTVYRNLSLLSEVGTIRRVRGLGGTEHFDADISEHQHFICKECGCVQDIYIRSTELMDTVNRNAGEGFNGNITGNDFYFFGFCNNCMDKAKTENII